MDLLIKRYGTCAYSQRGSLHVNEHTLQAILEMFPSFSRMRMLRQWGGVVDVTPDRSPILGKTPIENMFTASKKSVGV